MSLRSLRACMVCSYVQTGNQFQREGCPNCEDCTSAVFEGTITLNNVQGSWVAKWQRLEGYKPGVYAIKIEGNVSLSHPNLLSSKRCADICVAA